MRRGLRFQLGSVAPKSWKKALTQRATLSNSSTTVLTIYIYIYTYIYIILYIHNWESAGAFLSHCSNSRDCPRHRFLSMQTAEIDTIYLRKEHDLEVNRRVGPMPAVRIRGFRAHSSSQGSITHVSLHTYTCCVHAKNVNGEYLFMYLLAI